MASPTQEPIMAEGDDYANLTTAEASWDPRNLLAHADLLYLEARLIFSAMAIIFIGAHGALRRPPSAALPHPKSKDKKPRDEKDDHFTEGLTPSDAIMFPLMAGVVLVGLYYIIQWLQDPAILNNILRVYMSNVSVVSMGKLSADTLHLLTNLVFPSVWSNRRGQVFRIDPLARCQLLLRGAAGEPDLPVASKKTPLAGFASEWSFSSGMANMLWELRNLLTEEWTLRFAIHGICHEKFGIKLNDILGVMLAVGVTSTYYLTNAPWLSNLMGFGFCYGAFMIMSCTSFLTGTLVLTGLFVYDIVMVFYTPFMITVATKIDAPIKLVFEGAAQADGSLRSSLLGLGDIVVPGILMCLSLRFDLYRYWQHKIKYEPTQLTTEVNGGPMGETIYKTETRYRTIKLPFVDPQGQWGDRLWTSWRGLLSAPTATAELASAAFPKPYFYASMTGYAVGIVVTMTMLMVFRHGQPALLYLVPGVVGSVWLTGFLRGELHDMWTYTEDGSLDTKDVVVELGADGKVVKEIEGDKKKGEKKQEDTSGEKTEETRVHDKSTEEKDQAPEAVEEAKRKARVKGYDVFLLSISAPGQPDLKDD